MMIKKSELSNGLKKANNFYNNGQYEEALKFYLAVNQQLSDNSTGKKQLLFNIVLVYVQLRNPDKAKECLNQIEDDRLVANRRELALLYESLAVLFTIKHGEKEKFKTIAECYQLAALNFGKCKEWSQCLRNKIEAGRLLQKNNLIKESIVMADQVTADFIYLDDSNESAEILNNLAILYSKDCKSKESVITSGKLLKKAIQTFALNKQTAFVLNSNYVGVLNQLGIKLNKRFNESLSHELEFASEAKIFYFFNLAMAKFYSSEYKLALKLFLESLAILKTVDLKDKNISSEILEFISMCYFKLEDYEKSDYYLREALDEANSSMAKKRIVSKLGQGEKIAAKEKDDKPVDEVESQGHKSRFKPMIRYHSQQEEDTKSLIDKYQNLNRSKVSLRNIPAKELVEAD